MKRSGLQLVKWLETETTATSFLEEAVVRLRLDHQEMALQIWMRWTISLEVVAAVPWTVWASEAVVARVVFGVTGADHRLHLRQDGPQTPPTQVAPCLDQSWTCPKVLYVASAQSNLSKGH